MRPSPAAATPATLAADLETVERCDLCGGETFRLRTTFRDNILGGDLRWPLITCVGCGLHGVSPRPTRETIGRFYPDATTYVPYQQARSRRPSWAQRRLGSKGARPAAGLVRAILRLRQDYAWFEVPRWQGDGRILDIGCGTGKSLDVLKALGWSTFGVEMNPAAAEHARASGHEVVTGAADGAHFPPGSFDVVYLWHVLEHMHSPAATLAACRRALKPGGSLVMAVPNFNSLQSKIWRGTWAAAEAPRHLYQFTRATLRRYLEEASFHSIEMRTRTGAAVVTRGILYSFNRVLGTRWTTGPRWLSAAMEVPTMAANLCRFGGVGSEFRVTCQS